MPPVKTKSIQSIARAVQLPTVPDQLLGWPWFYGQEFALEALETDTKSISVSDVQRILVTHVASRSTGAYKITKIKEGGRSRDYIESSAPVHIETLVFNASEPVRLPCAFWVPGNTTVSVSLLDLSGNPNTVHLTWYGAVIVPGSDAEKLLKKLLRFYQA